MAFYLNISCYLFVLICVQNHVSMKLEIWKLYQLAKACLGLNDMQENEVNDVSKLH